MTTHSSLIFGKICEQIESIFSYGIDKTRTCDSSATKRLSLPVIVPLICPYASVACFMYSSATDEARSASRDPIVTS